MPRSASRRPDAKTRRPVRAWVRGLLIAIATFCLVAGFALWILTRSWFIIGRVAPVLEDRLGGDVSIGHAAYEGNGRFVFRDVSLRVPGRGGPSGEVCSIRRAQVITDMTALLAGDIRLEDVQISEPVIRISENVREAGVFNFMALRPRRNGTDELLYAPRVRIEKAIVEVGTHKGDDYTLHGRRALSGSMLPIDRGEGWYSVALVEVDRRGEVMEETEGGILVKGEWNARTNAHAFHINGLSLDDRAYGMGSQLTRLWWDRLNLAGRVSGVEVRWSPDEDFRVDFLVEDVGLTLPIETANLWARYEDGRIEPSSNRPRMHVRSGKISLSPEAITLDDLQGELLSAAMPDDGDRVDAAPAEADDAGAERPGVSDEEVVGVPYVVSVSITDLPALDWADKKQWMDKALAVAPFQMRFRTDDFRVQTREDGSARAVEMPLAVARVLERFRLTDWVLSTGITVTRQPPRRDADGELVAREIRSTGKAFITNAAATYEKFPYPLEDVEAQLEFDNDRIVVHYLTGTGSHEATVRLTGTIAPPSKYPAVDLRLTAHDVPVDERLRDALRETEQEIFDALMHRASHEALGEAGLLIDDEAIDSARRAQRAAAAERSRLLDLDGEATPAQQQRLAELTRIIDRNQRLVDAGPFRLGGTVDLDLNIERAEGRGRRTFTTGLVMIQSLGLLYERFPYPLQILGGMLNWQRDAVTIEGGEDAAELPIVTPGGGAGSLRGRLDLSIVNGRRRVVPDLTITIDDDEINEALYAAIPPVPVGDDDDDEPVEGWPGRSLSRGAQWLHDLGLQGTLKYIAHIGSDADDRLDYDIDLRLRDGRAQPTTAMTRALGAGLLEADLWRLEDCRASMTVTGDAIELEEFTARHLNGRVAVDGRIDLTTDPIDLALNMRLQQTALGEYLVNLLPSGQIEEARSLWERYRPEGTFDAELLYRQRGDEAEPIVLQIRPEEVALHVNDEAITLTPTGGELRIEGRQVHLDKLAMAVRRNEEDEGLIELNGAYGLPAPQRPGQALLKGSWDGGRLQSPLIGEALRRFGVPDLAERYAGYEPAGDFDASFIFESARADRPRRFELSVLPATVTFKLRQTPMFFELEEGSEVRFTPGLVELRNVRGESVGGRFDLGGQIRTTRPIEAALQFDFDGQLTSNQVGALLPETVKKIWEAIDFREGRASRLEDGMLRLTQLAGSEEESEWAVDFEGRLTVNDATFEAGLKFEDVTGPLQLRAGRRPPRPPYLQIDTQLDQVRTLGQHLTDARAAITLADDGRAVVLEEARADAQGGVATAHATIGIGERRDYAVSARLVGVPLGDFVVRPPSEDEPPPDEEEAPDRPPGLVYAGLDLSGQRDDLDSRIGRGTVRVLDGKLASIPLSLQLLHLLQFTSPSGGPDYASAEFFITGDRVTFERLLFESTRGNSAWLQLIGVGQMDLDTFKLDARFHSRSAVLVLRDLVGEIGDQLVAIEVTGPLWDPEASVITLPNINKPRSAIVGASPLLREGEK